MFLFIILLKLNCPCTQFRACPSPIHPLSLTPCSSSLFKFHCLFSREGGAWRLGYIRKNCRSAVIWWCWRNERPKDQSSWWVKIITIYIFHRLLLLLSCVLCIICEMYLNDVFLCTIVLLWFMRIQILSCQYSYNLVLAAACMCRRVTLYRY
jgi:hypothetical protein